MASRLGPAQPRGVTWNGAEGLADALAVAACEFLPHVLDHLPTARDHFQRLGDVLAQLGQARTAAARTGGRAGHDDPLARQVRGEWSAGRARAGKRSNVARVGGGDLGGQFFLGRWNIVPGPLPPRRGLPPTPLSACRYRRAMLQDRCSRQQVDHTPRGREYLFFAHKPPIFALPGDLRARQVCCGWRQSIASKR
jgi:hypothetical protein